MPGPLKRLQRSLDKIDGDYAGSEPWPPSASLLDIVRCTVIFDDPYAMAVFVAYLRKEFQVVRVKNRFENDEVEKVSVERLQAEFYAAETIAEDTESSSSGGSGLDTYDRMYRDVNLNLEMPRRVTNGLAVESHICEVQVTLSGITILKKSLRFQYNRSINYVDMISLVCMLSIGINERHVEIATIFF